MSKPSKKEWEEKREELGLYKNIYLLVDNIPFAIHEFRYKNKILKSIYIAGKFQGRWLMDHEFTKYFRYRRKCYYTKEELKKQYRFWKRYKGKKYADEKKESVYYEYYDMSFPSLNSIRLRLNKVAETIEFIEWGKYLPLSEQYRKKNPELFEKKTA